MQQLYCREWITIETGHLHMLEVKVMTQLHFGTVSHKDQNSQQ